MLWYLFITLVVVPSSLDVCDTQRSSSFFKYCYFHSFHYIWTLYVLVCVMSFFLFLCLIIFCKSRFFVLFNAVIPLIFGCLFLARPHTQTYRLVGTLSNMCSYIFKCISRWRNNIFFKYLSLGSEFVVLQTVAC